MPASVARSLEPSVVRSPRSAKLPLNKSCTSTSTLVRGSGGSVAWIGDQLAVAGGDRVALRDRVDVDHRALDDRLLGRARGQAVVAGAGASAVAMLGGDSGRSAIGEAADPFQSGGGLSEPGLGGRGPHRLRGRCRPGRSRRGGYVAGRHRVDLVACRKLDHEAAAGQQVARECRAQGEADEHPEPERHHREGAGRPGRGQPKERRLPLRRSAVGRGLRCRDPEASDSLAAVEAVALVFGQRPAARYAGVASVTARAPSRPRRPTRARPGRAAARTASSPAILRAIFGDAASCPWGAEDTPLRPPASSAIRSVPHCQQ